MRSAIRLLVLLTAVALVACGSDPVPLAQRFPTAADAPGTKPDPVETRHTTEDMAEFVARFKEALIDPQDEEMTRLFQEAGFVWGGLDTRFYGETHDPDAPHIFSSSIEFDSDDGAKSVLDWLETDGMKPCPESCATRVDTFDVDGITDARGVHRVATAEDIEAAGFEGEKPSESFWVGFTDGSIVYTVDLQGLPGSVTQEQALTVAKAFFERLTG
jgi:hypothetical protein